MTTAKYKRVLLKLSGEALAAQKNCVVDASILENIALQVKQVVEMGVGMGIVVGGGNIWRGVVAEKDGMNRLTADYAGMVATIINALALEDALVREGIDARTQSTINIAQVAEPYVRQRAIHHLKKGRVVIFAGGTGNPFVTTDTAAALRAIEIGAQVLMMCKNNVDGVYSDDPRKNPDAQKFDRLNHIAALNMQLGVMDSTALSLCQQNNLPLIVFDLKAPQSIKRVVMGEALGTIISSEGENG
jgi:uridylate kinase